MPGHKDLYDDITPSSSKQTVRLPPWALEPFLAGVLSAAAAIRKHPQGLRVCLRASLLSSVCSSL